MTNMSSVKAHALGLAKNASSTTTNGSAAAGAPKKKPKTRKRVNTAEKRASHNAVERQRRELLNGRFLDLARQLPSLAASRRPSKSAIVNASIAHLAAQREQRLLAVREMRRMWAEYEDVLEECNDWRKRNGVPVKQLVDGEQGWTRAMTEVCERVEGETFGTFDGGMGAEGEDGEGDMVMEGDITKASVDAEGEEEDDDEMVKEEEEQDKVASHHHHQAGATAPVLLGGMAAWLRANGVDASEFASVNAALIAAATAQQQQQQSAAWSQQGHHGVANGFSGNGAVSAFDYAYGGHIGGYSSSGSSVSSSALHHGVAAAAAAAQQQQSLLQRRMTTASASDAASSASPSSSTGGHALGNFHHPALSSHASSVDAYFGGINAAMLGGAPSPGSNVGVMTPPGPTAAFAPSSLSSSSSSSSAASSRRGTVAAAAAAATAPLMLDPSAQVTTLLSPSPPPVVAPTSFSVPGHTGDEVHDWAMQQRNEMFQQQDKTGGGVSGGASSAFDTYGFPAGFNAFGGGHGLASSLNAAHQTLLAHQPQLAAAVFPPPAFSASESPSTAGSDDVSALLAAFPHAAAAAQHVFAGATTGAHGLGAAAALAAGSGFHAGQPRQQSAEQLDQWRKNTSAAYFASRNGNDASSTTSAHQPSMNEIRQALRAGMSMGMGLVSNWSQASSEPSPP